MSVKDDILIDKQNQPLGFIGYSYGNLKCYFTFTWTTGNTMVSMVMIYLKAFTYVTSDVSHFCLLI